MLESGSVIHNYKIIEKIGEGGMGSVYLAEDTMLLRKVAIKVLNPLLTSDPQFVERFLNEARVQASLHHPGIVSLYSFFNEGDKYFMILEYAQGETLKEILQRQGKYIEENGKEIFKQILDAVGYAHQMGIVHRDLKPSNVMIDSSGKVKIMDFGIAKILGDRGMTKTGTKMGTLFYMSPEQVQSEKEIDQRSDIYSLGILYYEILTGELPLEKDTESDYAIMHQIVSGVWKRVDLQSKALSEKSKKVIKKMTELSKEERYKTCYRVTNDISGIEGDTSEIVVENKSKELEQKVSEQKKSDDIVTQILPANSKEKIIENLKSENEFQKWFKNNKKLAIASISVIVLMVIFIFLLPGKSNQEMVLVEGGTFTMAESQVTISSFYIGKYEVTQKLYREVMGNNPSYFKGDSLPVEQVSWYDAIEFCNLLSEKEGLTPVYTINGTTVTANWNANGYRLPTEAEWEYAARGGNKSKGYKYSGSNNVGDVGWYGAYDNSGNRTYKEGTAEVGTKQSNELGIYDMSGNVWEWCWDWYGDYTSESKTDPRGTASGSSRVLRGGSWFYIAFFLRTATRLYDTPSYSSISLGFRLVRTAR